MQKLLRNRPPDMADRAFDLRADDVNGVLVEGIRDDGGVAMRL